MNSKIDKKEGVVETLREGTIPEQGAADLELHDEQMRVEEAAEYVGVSVAEFEALAKRAGIGRHYDARESGQFVYARSDVDQVKKLHAAS